MTGWNIHHFEYFRKTSSFMFVFAIVNVRFRGISMEQPYYHTCSGVPTKDLKETQPPKRSEGEWKSLKLAFFLLKQHKKTWKNMEKVTPKFSKFQRNLRKTQWKKTCRKFTGSQRAFHSPETSSLGIVSTASGRMVRWYVWDADEVSRLGKSSQCFDVFCVLMTPCIYLYIYICISEIPSLKLTVRTWKLWIGRWFCFWKGFLIGAIFVSG